MNPLNQRAYYIDNSLKNPLLIVGVKMVGSEPCFRLAFRAKNGVWDYMYRSVINTSDYKIVGRFDNIQDYINDRNRVSA